MQALARVICEISLVQRNILCRQEDGKKAEFSNAYGKKSVGSRFPELFLGQTRCRGRAQTTTVAYAQGLWAKVGQYGRW